MKPAFVCAWEEPLMLHYAVRPEELQPFVPFPLDLWEGRAWVSLVAFRMRGMRPLWGGRCSALAFRAIATHEFLNIRTYVESQAMKGIYFLAEWLPNRWSVPLGRPAFGLPYTHGKLCFRHLADAGRLAGWVEDGQGQGVLRYRGRAVHDPVPCTPGTREEFLMERYIAFTDWHGWQRRFQVWHEPWRQSRAEVEILENTLMQSTGRWARAAEFMGASYAPSLRRVLMSGPATLPTR